MRSPTRPPWFGRLLAWRTVPGYRDLRETDYHGREYTIERLGRGLADQHGTRAGWHIWRQPEETGGIPGQLGGTLATTIGAARRMAELVIVARPPRYNQHGQPPTLLSVVAGTGPIPTVHGQALVLHPDHDRACVRVHEYDYSGTRPYLGTGPLVAELHATFALPAEPATEPIGIRWTVRLAAASAQAGPVDSWAAAYTALTDLLAREQPCPA